MINDFFYVYIYLDPRKPGRWEYKGLIFDHQPFYVGKGQGYRMVEHLYPCSLTKPDIKAKIINKIIKQGLEVIYYKIYERLLELESFEIEIAMIDYFGKIKDNRRGNPKIGILANCENGGQGRSGYKASEESKRKMSESSRGKFKPNSKRVDQFTLDGKWLAKWDSISKASIGTSLSWDLIWECCHGKSKTGGGFIFKFDGTSPYVKPPIKLVTPEKTVYQFSLEGEYIQSFKSCAEAQRFLGRPGLKSVSKCCRCEQTQAYGYKWSYSPP